METLVDQSNVLFILLGAIMVLAMHAGFAFLEGGNCKREKTK
jgi:Amt family ammonium transporter